MARFCSLFSSSSGNCTYIASSKGGVLIDAGVSARKITCALTARNIDPYSIKALFITHEHSDHSKGIKVFASRYNIPVYATEGTLKSLKRMNYLSDTAENFIVSYDGVEIEDLVVRPFRTPHDTPESCGYNVFLPGEKKVTVCTDIGHISSDLIANIYKSDIVLLESNHDVELLKMGPYPYELKKRILSDYGHLSNDCCSEAVVELLKHGTSRFFLGHLSEHNNLPDLAYSASLSALEGENAVLNRDFTLEVCMKESDRGVTVF